MTGRARRKNARQEQQLHHDVSLALAHRAATLRDVEREPARAIVSPAGERRISEDPSHMVEHAAVGGYHHCSWEWCFWLPGMGVMGRHTLDRSSIISGNSMNILLIWVLFILRDTDEMCDMDKSLKERKLRKGSIYDQESYGSLCHQNP